MVGQYIIVHNRGKWESRKKTENKNTEKNINTEKYWNNRRIKVKFDLFFFQCHFHIFCQVVSSSSSDEHQHEEEESGQFTEFQLETLKAHNELRLDLIWKLFWQNYLLTSIKMFFWHQSKWCSDTNQGKTWGACDGAQCKGKILPLVENTISSIYLLLLLHNCLYLRCARMLKSGLTSCLRRIASSTGEHHHSFESHTVSQYDCRCGQYVCNCGIRYEVFYLHPLYLRLHSSESYTVSQYGCQCGIHILL